MGRTKEKYFCTLLNDWADQANKGGNRKASLNRLMGAWRAQKEVEKQKEAMTLPMEKGKDGPLKRNLTR